MSELQVVLGTGPIGRETAAELAARGRRVRMVNRSGQLADAPAGVEVVAADLYDPAQVRRVAESAYAVYQCAQPGYTQWQEKFPPLQASILEGASAVGAKVIIADNLYMYGPVAGKLHEGLPYAATTKKGRVRAQMAEAALAAHRDGKVRVALARGSDFFGPYGQGSAMGERAFIPALKGKSASLIGNLDTPHSFTYVPDFGKTLAILGERDEALGRAWHVPNDRPDITQREFMNLVFREIGLPPKMSGMGKTMMRLGGLFIPEAREGIEMMYEFDEPFVVDSSQFEQAFGVKATPLAESIPATVAWYRSHAA
jgi:nucleoside-diphosphate-sugar epimerase